MIYFYTSVISSIKRLMKLTTILIISNNNFLLGQNLIQNGSFETSSDSNEPSEDSKLDYASPWKEDQKILKYNLTGKICWILHSPDYFKCNGTMKLSDILFYQNNPNIGQYEVNICGADGNCFIGLHEGELAEQELFKKLDNGATYRLSFYVRTIVRGIWSPISRSDESAIEMDILCTKYYTQHLKFYIAKNKIKYGGDPITCIGANNMGSWTNFKDFTNNNVHEIKDLPYNGTIFPYNSWHLVELELQIPSNSEEYNWLGFEVQDSDSLHPYILLDNFSLYKKGCEPDNCSQISGDISATANEYHTKSNPWFIDNIGNVSKATIEIRTILGQELKRTIEVTATNGIKNRIYWDGKDANNTELATASYLFKVKLENECESTDANMVVWVDNQSAGSFTYPTYSYDNSGYKIPKECCVTDIYIDNVSLGGPDPKRFVASHSVNVATLPASWVTLTPNADVLFRAGSFVEVGPGFDPDNGTYNVEVVPCPGRYSNPEDEDNIIPSYNYVNLENDENKEDIKGAEKEITLYPNPTNDKLFFTNLVDETYTLNIKDGVGKIILNQSINSNGNSIDCSQLASGIYFVLISKDNKKLYYKFVKN
jgi:hypothetical protein